MPGVDGKTFLEAESGASPPAKVPGTNTCSIVFFIVSKADEGELMPNPPVATRHPSAASQDSRRPAAA
jgi:hypothetical protein